jgi:sugar-specific transcriptional regulator TrmB
MKLLIDKLQKLGLSKRESEIYLALRKRKEFTAPEIGKITSVSRNKSYEIL